MLFRFLFAEFLKLRRSLALLLVASAPLFVAGICLLIGVHNEKPFALDRYSMSASALWAFAMLPMSVTALSVLMAQMEHGPKTWDHFLALPGARRWLFPAKALAMMIFVVGMTAWLYVLLLIGAWLGAQIHPVTGAFDAPNVRLVLMKMTAASLLLCVIQLWTALRFRSFVPPLVLGITGTFVSVAAAGAREGAYFPWLMPLHMLSTEADMQRMAMWIGCGGGIVAMAVMLADLSRREA
jgi:ABC-2 type transport system permease protein